jgi:hypothetical protein
MPELEPPSPSEIAWETRSNVSPIAPELWPVPGHPFPLKPQTCTQRRICATKIGCAGSCQSPDLSLS